jgi:hypothetical protein
MVTQECLREHAMCKLHIFCYEDRLALSSSPRFVKVSESF